MTSKKLFLADYTENFKRRNWVFWLQFLAFFSCFPGAILLGLNNISQRYSDNTALIGGKLSAYTLEIFDMNEGISIIIVGLAILTGIQAFSWLHHKKKVNFYHSQPVSRNRRFLVIWINGIVCFFISYIANLGLGMAAAASYGCLTGEILTVIPRALLAHSLLFMSIYHVAIIAVMLTGHTLVSLIGTVILLTYEIAVRALYTTLASAFFRTYGYRESSKILNTLLSPLVTFFHYLFGRNNRTYGVEQITYTETIFTMTGLALFFGLAGWLLYKARPSESHGKSISFPQIKEPLKVLLLLVFGTAGGLFIYDISGSSDAFGIVGVIFAAVIGHGVIELIYEVDFRAIRKGLIGLGLSAALAVFIFIAFRWDIFGYDDKIPGSEQVESVALTLEKGYGGDNTRVLLDGTEVSVADYWRAEMELKDMDMVYRLLDNRVNVKQPSEYENLYRLEVVFNLKRGKTSYRTFYFSYKDNLEVMNEIFHTPEYQKTTNQLMEDNFVQEFNIFKADYENGRTTYAVPASKVGSLLEAYVKDVNNTEFADINNSIPVGRLVIGGRGIQNKEYVNQWGVTIYPTFMNTISLLEQCGITTETVYDQEYMERIKSISIVYTDYEAWEASGQPLLRDYRREIVFADKEDEAKLSGGFSDNGAEVFYVEAEKLKEIVDNACLQEITHWNPYEGMDFNTNYEIYVGLYEHSEAARNASYTVEEYGKVYTYSEAYFFKEGQIPEFVTEAIREISQK